MTYEKLKIGLIGFGSVGKQLFNTLLENDYTENMDLYFNALESVCQQIAGCEKEKLQTAKLLEGPICNGGFKRLKLE